jgi:hypothetical protein
MKWLAMAKQGLKSIEEFNTLFCINRQWAGMRFADNLTIMVNNTAVNLPNNN